MSDNARPRGRLVVEVVIPTRKHSLCSDDRLEPVKETPGRQNKRNRFRRLSNEDDSDYSPGPRARTPLLSPLRTTRKSRRTRSISSTFAGPSRDNIEETTPISETMLASGSSSSGTQTESLTSLVNAVDFLTDPDAILVDAGDDLRLVTCASPPPDDDSEWVESKPTPEFEPVHHDIDMSKLSPEPSTEPEEMEDPGIDCTICYESIVDVCKKAEDEGKGGIGGGLAIFACDQEACGAIFCLSCIIAAANSNIRNRKPVACPLCTRPMDLKTIRSQATTYDPADATDPIIDPPPPPPPLPGRPPPANVHLREQHVHSVIAFHRASRPGQKYFINSFNEFAEYLKFVNPAAAEANPAGIQWLATSAWEAFWCTYIGKSWRGLHRLRLNSFLMTVVKGLDIKMPPGGEEMNDRQARNHLVADLAPPPDAAGPADPAVPEGPAAPRVRFDLPIEEDLPALVNGRAGRRFAGARNAILRYREQAREAAAARDAARDPDEVAATRALARLMLPALPPIELVGPHFTPLGADRPALIHHRAGLDLMLQEHRSEEARRGWMRMMFALPTDREADILYANLRRAYNLDMVNPEVQPTQVELERMQVMRHAWALMNEGRQALMAAQAHQLPVAVFDHLAPGPAPVQAPADEVAE